MSEEGSTAPTSQPIAEEWGDQIEEPRKQEMWARLRAWWDEADHGEGAGPSDGQTILAFRLADGSLLWSNASVTAMSFPSNFTLAH